MGTQIRPLAGHGHRRTQSGPGRGVAYSRKERAENVREVTGGAGGHVVLDGVGGETGTSSFGAAAWRPLLRLRRPAGG
ncbi:hypothetical protein ACFQZ2_08965, partial [Streptomonospora algeriensis]